MPGRGWKRLVAGAPWFRGEGSYRIDAYSEFMPPPRLGRRPYGSEDPALFAKDDPYGWRVSEYEESFELQPGMELIAGQIVDALVHLGEGRPAEGIPRSLLEENPYWPPELADRAGGLRHERYVTLMPLALSRTQDDLGRVRWTFFGGSERGPQVPFWRSFFENPRRAAPTKDAIEFLRNLFRTAYGVRVESAADIVGAGFRILPPGGPLPFPSKEEGPLPGWTAPFLWDGRGSAARIRYLLTFRPYSVLPASIRAAYLSGRIHLLPFPGSLVFWGARSYLRLQKELPMALQIPLLNVVERHGGPHGIRVPQSGWLRGPSAARDAGHGHHGPFLETYKRTHRWMRARRHEDEVSLAKVEHKLLHVLFGSSEKDLGLYDKPMARNVQIWTEGSRLLLGGPGATEEDVLGALHAVMEGGVFGYRFQFPPMQVGRHEVYWHRPLAACLSRETGKPAVIPGAPPGYMTAYTADKPDLSRPVELWPRLLRRELHLSAVDLFRHATDGHPYQTVLNVRKLLDAFSLFGDTALPMSFARRLLSIAKEETIDGWLDSLPGRAVDPDCGRRLSDRLRREIERHTAPASDGRGKGRIEPLTFGRTARRSFEVAYWKTISRLAEGRFVNKDNADCVRDPATQALLTHTRRDLDALGDFLISSHSRAISAAGLAGKALVGDLPFRWTTGFDLSWSGGWLGNRDGRKGERNIFCLIPGRDRRRAVIMADHYDTAYMEDCFEKNRGARIAAAGADDNHSATAALLLSAPVFCELSRAGRLACDVWLVHLTGEEFPSDSLGARHLCQRLVEGTLAIRLPGGAFRDLSDVRIQGIYVLDMIAHNSDRNRDVFQISPGKGRDSAWLSLMAHMAAEAWNDWAEVWNRRPSRRGPSPGSRKASASAIPPVAPHSRLHGEIRPHYDPRSTLFNTDAVIFSDAGIPVTLIMENYDIDRTGYHDSHDTMANIDLDYGAALAAIAIESVARAASGFPFR